MHVYDLYKTSAIVLLAMVISACNQATHQNSSKNNSESAKETGEFTVTVVNNITNTLINDTDLAANVFFESDKLHSCELYFIKSKFSQGYSVSAKFDPVNITSNPDVDLICSIDNQHFSLAGSKTNYVEMSIPQVAATSQIKLSFSLSNIAGKKKFERKNVILDLNRMQTSSMQ